MAFRYHDCGAIAALGPQRDQRQLYAGLGDACRALRSNDDRLWTSAQVALQHSDDPPDCLDQLALRLLRDLVMAHQRAPRAEIHIDEPPAGTGCGSVGPVSPAPSTTPTPTSSTPSSMPKDRVVPVHRPRQPVWSG